MPPSIKKRSAIKVNRGTFEQDSIVKSNPSNCQLIATAAYTSRAKEQNFIEHTITLEGPAARGLSVNWATLSALGGLLSNSTRRVLRLRADGRSSLVRPPHWLESATQLSIELYSDGPRSDRTNVPTRLITWAPPLAVVAPNAFDQLQLWGDVVAPQETAISLLEAAVRDAVGGKSQSLLIDRAVLGSLSKFSEMLDLGFDAISLNGGDAPPVTIDRAALQQVERMEMAAPPPRKVIVSGTVDMLRNSQNSFVLQVKGGRKIRGFYPQSSSGSIASFYAKQVVIDGEAHFRPSGNILSFVASSIRLAGPGDEIWSTVPKAPPRSVDEIKPRNPAMAGRNPFARLFGAWPGDETEEEIEEMLSHSR